MKTTKKQKKQITVLKSYDGFTGEIIEIIERATKEFKVKTYSKFYDKTTFTVKGQTVNYKGKTYKIFTHPNFEGALISI